jgi:hypothetical protein
MEMAANRALGEFGRMAMFTPHNELKQLIEFSIENNLESALRLFSMFSPQQIQKLYDISISQRIQLLQEWGVEDSTAAHFLRHFHDPHNPAQAEKIRQQARDPSNR